MFVALAFWAIILFPIGVLAWQIRRLRHGKLSKGRIVTTFFLMSVAPVALYAMAFFLAVAIEEISGTSVTGEGYARSLLLVLAVGGAWVLLVTAVFSILVALVRRKTT